MRAPRPPRPAASRSASAGPALSRPRPTARCARKTLPAGARRVPAPASCTESPAPAAHPARAGAAAPAATPRTLPSHAPCCSQRRRDGPRNGPQAPPASTSASGRLPVRPGTLLAPAAQFRVGRKADRSGENAGGGGQARARPFARRGRLDQGRLPTPSRHLGGRDSAPALTCSANGWQMAARCRVLAEGQWREWADMYPSPGAPG